MIALTLCLAATVIAAIEAYRSYPRPKPPALRYRQYTGRKQGKSWLATYLREVDRLEALASFGRPEINARTLTGRWRSEDFEKLAAGGMSDIEQHLAAIAQEQAERALYGRCTMAHIPPEWLEPPKHPGFKCSTDTPRHTAPDLTRIDADIYLDESDYRRFAKQPPRLRIVPTGKGGSHEC